MEKQHISQVDFAHLVLNIKGYPLLTISGCPPIIIKGISSDPLHYQEVS